MGGENFTRSESRTRLERHRWESRDYRADLGPKIHFVQRALSSRSVRTIIPGSRHGLRIERRENLDESTNVPDAAGSKANQINTETCASRWRVFGRVCRLGGTRPRRRDAAASSDASAEAQGGGPGPSKHRGPRRRSATCPSWSRRRWSRPSEQPVRAESARGPARAAGSTDAGHRRDAARSVAR